jgi:hypothetical protein
MPTQETLHRTYTDEHGTEVSVYESVYTSAKTGQTYGPETIERATILVRAGHTAPELVNVYRSVHPTASRKCWDVVGRRVVVRFRTGTKEHLTNCQAIVAPGGWVAQVSGFRNANTCSVVRWEKPGDAGSEWNRPERSE